MTEAPFRRLDILVGISYDSDIRQAKEALTDMLNRDEDVVKEKEMAVFVDSLGESSVNLGIRFWVKKEDYWTVKWRLTEETKYTLDRAGITIPFPQLDVHQV